MFDYILREWMVQFIQDCVALVREDKILVIIAVCETPFLIDGVTFSIDLCRMRKDELEVKIG